MVYIETKGKTYFRSTRFCIIIQKIIRYNFNGPFPGLELTQLYGSDPCG